MQLSDLQAEVLFNTFDTTKYAGRSTRHLNDAVKRICRRMGMLKLYEVAPYDSLGVVTTSQSFQTIEECWDSNGPASTGNPNAGAGRTNRRLVPLPAASGFSFSGQNGAPAWYQVEPHPPNVTIRIWPHQASGFVALAGEGFPATMGTATDVSGLGDEFDEALIAYARCELFRSEDDFEAATAWRAQFEDTLKHLSFIRDPSDDGPIQLPGTW